MNNYLHENDRTFFNHAKACAKGKPCIEKLSALLFCALALEARLNISGAHHIDCWEHLEKELSPTKKLEMLNCKLSLGFSKGCEPWQTFTKIFKTRNVLVHLKIDQGQMPTSAELSEIPMPLWQTELSKFDLPDTLEKTKNILVAMKDR